MTFANVFSQTLVFIGFCSVIIYLGYQVVYSWFTLLKKWRLIISGLQRYGLLLITHGGASGLIL